jgi:hypothetical protein
MTDWAQLTHAYGNADDVPGLLDQAGPGLEDPAWNELWSRLCHQGTVYTASFAALPALTQKARQWPAAERVMPLYLAGAIVSSTDRPHGEADPHVAYSAEVTELAELTKEALRHSGLAGDPNTYVELLQTLLGFEGVEVWSEHLDGLNTEEYEIPCPRCDAENFVVFGQYGHFSTIDSMYMNNAETKRIPLLPASPEAMKGLAQRLHTSALADGHPEVANKLSYVFGSAQCAECDVLFNVDEAVVARWGT